MRDFLQKVALGMIATAIGIVVVGGLVLYWIVYGIIKLLKHFL